MMSVIHAFNNFNPNRAPQIMGESDLCYCNDDFSDTVNKSRRWDYSNPDPASWTRSIVFKKLQDVNN